MSRRPGRATIADGALAGVVAGVVSGAPSTAIALARGDDPLQTAAAAGTLAVPSSASRATQLVAGAAVHATLSVGWGVVLAVVVPRRRAVVGGALAGLAIAALDLGVVGRRHPAIAALPTGPQLLDHVAYGAVAGAVLARRTRIADSRPNR